MTKYRMSDQAMLMVKDCANTLMDGRAFEIGEGPVLGALVSMAHDELAERRAADLSARHRELIDWALGVLSSDYNDVPHDEIADLRKLLTAARSE